MSNSNKKYIRVLRMERNSYSGCAEHEENTETGNNNNGICDFYLFDYFDRLSVLREKPLAGETGLYQDFYSLDYTDCFGMNNFTENNYDTPPSVASQLLSIVRYGEDSAEELGGNDLEEDPFCTLTKSSGYCMPFIALIFVNISNYKCSGSYINDAENKHISECVDEITRITDEVINALYDHSEEEPIFTVCHTVNTNDLCIVLRTQKVSDAYIITHYITQAHNLRASDNDSIIKSIIYSSFTIVGIDKNASFEMLKNAMECKRYIRNIDGEVSEIEEDHQVVLRLQVNNDEDKTSIFKEYNRIISQQDCAAFGLYGRYNLSIQISLNEFIYLYPELMSFKFCEASDKNFELPKGTPEYIKQLRNDIKEKKIIVVNERIMVNLSTINFCTEIISKSPRCIFGKVAMHDAENQRTLIEKLISLQYNMIKKISSYEVELPYFRYEYKEVVRQLYELHRTYADLWYQQDTMTNGSFFFVQMYSIIKNIDLTMYEIIWVINQGDISPESNYNLVQIVENLIESIRIAVDSMNIFHKLLQTVNQQTIQAPNYEILTKVDTEKYIVAYFEFLRIICRNHTRKYRNNAILPIFVTDLSVSAISATTLFEKTNLLIENNIGMPENSDNLPTIITIRTPNIESFARAFETIPQLCHEITHGLQLCENKMQIRVISHIFCDILANVISSYLFESKKIIYDINDPIYKLYVRNIIKGLNDAILGSQEDEVDKESFVKSFLSSVDCEKFGNNIIPIYREKCVLFLSGIFSNTSRNVYDDIHSNVAANDCVNQIYASLKYLYKFIFVFSSVACDIKAKVGQISTIEKFIDSFEISEVGYVSHIDAISKKVLHSLDDFLKGKGSIYVHSNCSDEKNSCIVEVTGLILPIAIRVTVAKFIICSMDALILSDIPNLELDKVFDKTFRFLNIIPKWLVPNSIYDSGRITEFDVVDYVDQLIVFIQNDLMTIQSNKAVYFEISNAFDSLIETMFSILNHVRNINKTASKLPSELTNKSKKWSRSTLAESISKGICYDLDNMSEFDVEKRKLRACSKEMSLLMTHHVKFSANIISDAFKDIHAEQYIECIDYSIAVWNETCADLNMCSICNFDAFGYFKFYSDALSSKDTYIFSRMNEYDPNLERFKYVLAVLICESVSMDENTSNNAVCIDIGNLIESVKQYINNLFLTIYEEKYYNIFRYTFDKLYGNGKVCEINGFENNWLYQFIAEYHERIMDSFSSTEPFSALDISAFSRDMLHKYSEYINEFISNNSEEDAQLIFERIQEIVLNDTKELSVVRGSSESGDDESLYNKILDIFSGIIVKHYSRTLSRINCAYTLLNVIVMFNNRKKETGTIDYYFEVDEYLLNCFRSVYRECHGENQSIDSKENRNDTFCDNILDDIEHYYNDASQRTYEEYRKEFSDNQLLVKTISFVLDYYYKNRYWFSSFLSKVKFDSNRPIDEIELHKTVTQYYLSKNDH